MEAGLGVVNSSSNLIGSIGAHARHTLLIVCCQGKGSKALIFSFFRGLKCEPCRANVCIFLKN